MESNQIYRIAMLKSEATLLQNCMAKTKDGWEVMKCLHIEDGACVTTDGKRLVIINNGVKVPNGTYTIKAVNKLVKTLIEVMIETVIDDPLYPDYKQVVHKDEPELCKIRLAPDTIAISKAVIMLHKHTGRAINYSFLEDLTTPDLCAEWVVYGTPDNAEKPLFLKLIKDDSVYIQAVVSPFQLKDQQGS